MATNRKIYEIRLEDISQNGALCQSPTVEFEKPYCTEIRCYTEVSDGEFVLKIEIPEDCPDPCVYAVIDCADDCGECEPERVQICPCVEDADCPDCQVCENNLCVSTCTEDEFCSADGDCVECDDEHACPCNQVCVNGDCQCPPGSPYEDSKGCCSDCSVTALCPVCYVCTVDGCVPTVCPVGVCDPDTGDCVECLGTGDCAGDNECCIDKVCACCEGFVRDPGTGDCVPDPGCISDLDCPECEICTETGCEPQSCPAGYVFTGTSPCCQKECDCDAPDCPGVQHCVVFDDDTCVCAPCSGACDENEDCGEGCYCNQGQCVTNPCYGWCYDGADCGEGCGCNDGRCFPCESLSCGSTECDNTSGCACVNNSCEEEPTGCYGACNGSDDCGDGCGCFQGECVSCEALTCSNCLFAAGCDCIDDIACEESACKGGCAGPDDCPGVDCGCYNFECVECQAYSCDVDACPEGCVCDSGTCVGNPCANVNCEQNADCGINCSCEEGICTPCPEDNPNCGGEDCGDLLILGKDDENCIIEATLSQDACCACREIVMGVEAELAPSPGVDGRWNLDLRVGQLAGVYTNLPLVGTVNDTSGNPVYPTIQTNLKIKRRTYTTSGSSTNFTLTPSSLVGTDTTFANEIEFVVPGTGDIVKVEYVINGTIEFADECIYTIPTDTVLFTYTAAEGSSGFDAAYDAVSKGIQFHKDTLCRSPLFAFRKGTTVAITNAATPFVYTYGEAVPPPSPTDQKIWQASIDLADGLAYGLYYEVEVDCGCPENAMYSCYGPGGTPTKLVFCHLEEADILYTVDPATNCTDFDFDQDVVIDCDVMAAGNPKYRVLVNGEILNTVAEVTAVAGTIPLVALGTITTSELVESVGLRLVEDVCENCDVSVTNDCDEFAAAVALSKDSCDISGTFTATITTSADPLDQLQYTISDSGGVIDTAAFYNSNIVVTGLADPAGAEPITVTVERISDGVIVTVVQLFNPDGYTAAEKLLLDTGCSGTLGYVRGTNNFTTSATLQVFAAGTLTSLGSANVAPGGTGTVTFPEDTLVDITLSLNADPTCAVSETDVVVNCCDDISALDFVVEHTCTDVDIVELSYSNNSGATMTFRLTDSSGALISTKIVADGSTVYDEVVVDITKTYYVNVRSANSSDCPQVLLYTFDAADCCDDILDRVVISRECRSGNGPGAVGTLVVTNGTIGPKTIQVYLVVGSSSTLLYSGNGATFEYTPSSAPSSASINVAVDGCEKTEAFFFNCEA